MPPARSLVVVAALALSCGASTPQGTTPVASASAPLASSAAPDASAPVDDAKFADAATWARWTSADYVVFTPASFVDALAPLVQHRETHGHTVAVIPIEPLFARFSNGARKADALERALAVLVTASHGKVHYVVLAGDCAHANAGSDDAHDTTLPTFYLPKLHYEHHTPFEHQNPRAVTRDEHSSYPSDHPLELSRGEGAGRVAVGRLPAHTTGELSSMIAKIVAYETHPSEGDWRRRVTLYTGPARYGEQTDALIESVATHLLDEELSYDFDLDFTFAKPDTAYSYPPSRLRKKLVHDLDQGSLVAAYVGHGAVANFDHVEWRSSWYEIGTADDAAQLAIAEGKPVFFSFACDTGAFDRPNGELSIAEAMIANPNGPVAVLASSRESHPYPNAVMAMSVIRTFLDAHAATIGDGVLAVKDSLAGSSLGVNAFLVDEDLDALAREHEGLYNLFGDPATPLAYPDAVVITPPSTSPKSGGSFAIDVRVDGIATGDAIVTLETRRSKIRGALVSPSALAAMSADAAAKAMEKNHATASDKVVSRATAKIDGGSARVTLTAPVEPGAYIVKVFAHGGGRAAAGSAKLRVLP
jgi:Peptidase family C25